MSNIQFSITPSQTTENVYIRASQVEFNELGIGKQKTGFILVQADKAPALLEMFEKNELSVEFGKTKNTQGLYDVEVVEVEVPESSDLIHK